MYVPFPPPPSSCLIHSPPRVFPDPWLCMALLRAETAANTKEHTGKQTAHQQRHLKPSFAMSDDLDLGDGDIDFDIEDLADVMEEEEDAGMIEEGSAGMGSSISKSTDEQITDETHQHQPAHHATPAASIGHSPSASAEVVDLSDSGALPVPPMPSSLPHLPSHHHTHLLPQLPNYNETNQTETQQHTEATTDETNGIDTATQHAKAGGDGTQANKPKKKRKSTTKKEGDEDRPIKLQRVEDGADPNASDTQQTCSDGYGLEFRPIFILMVFCFVCCLVSLLTALRLFPPLICLRFVVWSAPSSPRFRLLRFPPPYHWSSVSSAASALRR